MKRLIIGLHSEGSPGPDDDAPALPRSSPPGFRRASRSRPGCEETPAGPRAIPSSWSSRVDLEVDVIGMRPGTTLMIIAPFNPHPRR